MRRVAAQVLRYLADQLDPPMIVVVVDPLTHMSTVNEALVASLDEIAARN